MDNHAIATAGLTGAGRPLTYGKAIQQTFGHHDIRQMREYAGPTAQASVATLGAQAYSSNGRVAFADSPDLYTQAHEAAHAVQQTALGSGLQLMGGLGAEDDKYEQHADAVANAVVQGESAEALLDQLADGPTTVVPGMVGTAGPVQMIKEKQHKKNVRKDPINEGHLHKGNCEVYYPAAAGMSCWSYSMRKAVMLKNCMNSMNSSKSL